MNKPWLSIVIPIYNAEKHLTRCIDSILKQSFTDFEVILVDDESTDGSSEICKKYSTLDKRIKYFRKPNGGSYQTRIYGAEKVSGEYVLFCDSDDYYYTRNAFKILYNEATKQNIQLIQFSFKKKYNHMAQKEQCVNDVITINQEEFIENEFPNLLCNGWNTGHLTGTVWSKLYHISLVKNLESSENACRIFMGDDYILNMQMLEKCSSVKFIPDVIYCYQVGIGGMSNFSRNTMKELDVIKRYQLSYLNNYNDWKKEKIKELLFEELANWFLLYLFEAIDHLSIDEVYSLITESLELEQFKLAQEYYSNKIKLYQTLLLLKEASPEKYIDYIQNNNKSTSFKMKFIELLKNIYKKI